MIVQNIHGIDSVSRELCIRYTCVGEFRSCNIRIGVLGCATIRLLVVVTESAASLPEVTALSTILALVIASLGCPSDRSEHSLC